jgi:aspartate carbamoyltransferase regulatory subunit
MEDNIDNNTKNTAFVIRKTLNCFNDKRNITTGKRSDCYECRRKNIIKIENIIYQT